MMVCRNRIPDSKIHGANMGPTWVLSAPDWPHVGPMNLAIWDEEYCCMNHSGTETGIFLANQRWGLLSQNSFIPLFFQFFQHHQSIYYMLNIMWVRSRNCGCLVTWFCYQLTATAPWPDPCTYLTGIRTAELWCQCSRAVVAPVKHKCVSSNVKGAVEKKTKWGNHRIENRPMAKICYTVFLYDIMIPQQHLGHQQSSTKPYFIAKILATKFDVFFIKHMMF